MTKKSTMEREELSQKRLSEWEAAKKKEGTDIMLCRLLPSHVTEHLRKKAEAGGVSIRDVLIDIIENDEKRY
jgi:hypothetical protein